MEYVIDNLRDLKAVHLEKIEMLELAESIYGWTQYSSQAIGKHKEKVDEIDKAIIVLTMHEGALKFMCD